MKPDNEYIYFAPTAYVKSKGTLVKDGIVVHYVDDVFYGYHSQCPHKPEEGNLSIGTFCPLKKTVICNIHHFEFCIKSGENIKEPLRKFGGLRLLTVYEEDANLYIKITQNEEAKL
jgi:nitrite reductase/ring-hydroxylating ferredoxin subunit